MALYIAVLHTYILNTANGYVFIYLLDHQRGKHMIDNDVDLDCTCNLVHACTAYLKDYCDDDDDVMVVIMAIV